MKKIISFWLLNTISALLLSGFIFDYLEAWHPSIANNAIYFALVITTSFATAFVLNTTIFKHPIKTVLFSVTASAGSILLIAKIVYLFMDSLF